MIPGKSVANSTVIRACGPPNATRFRALTAVCVLLRQEISLASWGRPWTSTNFTNTRSSSGQFALVLGAAKAIADWAPLTIDGFCTISSSGRSSRKESQITVMPLW